MVPSCQAATGGGSFASNWSRLSLSYCWLVLPLWPLTIAIERLRLSPDRRAIQVSPGLTLADIPEDCFRYVLGHRSALEWVLEQYQLRRDPRSGIVLDPNRPDDPDYIVRLLKQIVTVSLQTLTLVAELEQAVTPEDWQAAFPSA
jgi:hypothetical protein